MQVTVEFTAQIKRAAGTAKRVVNVPSGATLADVLTEVSRDNTDLANILLKADGRIQPTLLLFVNDSQFTADDASPLPDASTITLLAPISGG